ncbi:peptidase family M48-domain-containing protein [Daedaleopsis nitida]|nr:peptidase family M48-domain-containing protein [Daedaleopsis nitida]
MFTGTSRIAQRCFRGAPLSGALPKGLQARTISFTRSSRASSNFPGGSPRYVRFGSDGAQGGKPGGSGSPWDVRRWDRSTKIVAGVGSLAVAYYIAHLEQVPETGRWRFMDISPKYETMLAEASHQELMSEFQGKVLPPNHPLSRHVRRVTTRILEASGLGVLDAPDVTRPKGTEELWSFNGAPEEMPPEVGGTKKWHLFVVNDDKVVNAMASYGSIVVFTGILPVAKDENGLAAILGHEIGHAVARHASERYSSMKVLLLLAAVLEVIGMPFSTWAAQLLYELPNSRTQEYEADKIGIRLSSRACFDPAAVPEVFTRLGRLEQATHGRHIDFLATHPASEKRSDVLREMLPEAYAIQAASPSCGSTADHMAAFRDLWSGGPDPERMSEARWS